MYALNSFTVEVDQVCVNVCRLSNMVHIVPCHKAIDAQRTAQLLLNHVFRLYDYLRIIVSLNQCSKVLQPRVQRSQTIIVKIELSFLILYLEISLPSGNNNAV
ncbi:hypothetical protein ACTFIW_005492 [Dictyostelium discoideum]